MLASRILLLIVAAGMIINCFWFIITLTRKVKLTKAGVVIRRSVAHLTLIRTIRIELIFFLIQALLLWHTIYTIQNENIFEDNLVAVFTRVGVVILLVIASTFDYRDRVLISRELDKEE